MIKIFGHLQVVFLSQIISRAASWALCGSDANSANHLLGPLPCVGRPASVRRGSLTALILSRINDLESSQ